MGASNLTSSRLHHHRGQHRALSDTICSEKGYIYLHDINIFITLLEIIGFDVFVTVVGLQMRADNGLELRGRLDRSY